MNLSNNSKKLGVTALILALVLFLTFGVPNLIGLARSGFESSEVLGIQTFYLIHGIFAFIIFLAVVYEVSDSYKDKEYGVSVAFANKGEFPHFSIFKRFTYLQLALLSLIFFSILAFINNLFVGQSIYKDVSFLTQQQFGVFDNILYSILQIPGAENLGLAMFIAVMLIGIGIYARSKNLNKINYVIFSFILITIMSGLLGVGWHLIRYSGSETSLVIVFLFWAIGGFITMATGSFIPFWMFHIINNFFLYMQTFFSSDSSRIIIAFVILCFIGLYFYVYRGRLIGGNNETPI